MKYYFYLFILLISVSCKKEYRTVKQQILPDGYYELCYVLPISGGWYYYTFFYVKDDKFYCSNNDSVACYKLAGEFTYDKYNKLEVPVLCYKNKTEKDPCKYYSSDTAYLYLLNIKNYLSSDSEYVGLEGDFKSKTIWGNQQGSFQLYRYQRK